MKIYFLIIIFSVLTGEQLGYSQPISVRTQKQQRQAFIEQLQNMDLQLLQDESLIQKNLWQISAFNCYGKREKKYLRKLMSMYHTFSPGLQYQLLTAVACTTVPGKNEWLRKVMNIGNNKQKCLAYSLLRKENLETDSLNLNDESWNSILGHIHVADYKFELHKELLNDLPSFLKVQFPEQIHLIVLLRHNRNIPAKVYIWRNEEGWNQEFFIYLARAASDILPYFSNGNTPCGVFKIKEKAESENEFIGPTPTLITVLPFESLPLEWEVNNQSWDTSIYRKFLPERWRDIPLLWQTYSAGQVGRKDIIVHGSTISPLFFEKFSFFPLTPSLGCLSALELWNAYDGSRIESHQQRLIDCLSALKRKLGLMYVIQVDEETYKLGFN